MGSSLQHAESFVVAHGLLCLVLALGFLAAQICSLQHLGLVAPWHVGS